MKRELIHLENVAKSFGNLLVLDEIDLTIMESEFITLLGPSGCGKTTMLRIIGGFEMPDTGRVIFDGKDITNPIDDRLIQFSKSILSFLT